MAKQKKSGPAIFMYCVIALGAVISTVCFYVYYTSLAKNSAVLWSGIVAFMVMYHLWMRIIMGNVSKLFKISYKSAWFKERKFEKNLYKKLNVKKWKDKALTYNPEQFSLKKCTLENIADTTAKAETDHWINEVISISAIAFSLIWGQTWMFFTTSVAAMLFDAQFIIIQRYNRPRILKLMKKKEMNAALKV